MLFIIFSDFTCSYTMTCCTAGGMFPIAVGCLNAVVCRSVQISLPNEIVLIQNPLAHLGKWSRSGSP